jgi:predicted DsbA family dithiol-disulfide isomerase
VEVEIWSDVTCPWCLMGKQRLEAALERFEHRDEVDVVWRSFELHPEAPGAANTFDAHRLLQLAAEHGRQGELEERLLRAHLDEREPVGDPAILARLAGEAGLPADEVRDVLAGDRYAEAVRADEQLAKAVEITVVPFFAVDRDLAVSGAQTPDVLLELLQQSWDRAERRRA